MHTTTFPAAAIALPSDSFAIDIGRKISAALFAFTAVTLFVFALQSLPAPTYFGPSISVRLAPPQIPDISTEQTYAFSDKAGLIARWQPFIAEASNRFAIPEAWIEAVMRAESGGRTTLAGRPITSKAGAAGLMQLMGDTYKEMRDRYRLGSDVHNPRDNILAGTAYLNQLRGRYGYPNLFAAYNAGPKRLDQHLQQGKSLPRETRHYLGAVVQSINVAMTATGLKPTQMASNVRVAGN